MSGEFDWDAWEDGRDAGKALETGDVETLEQLFHARPEMFEPISNLFLTAVQSQPLKTVHWLLDHGARPRITVDDGFPVMHVAMDREMADRYDIVTELIRRGADPNERGFNDWTPLHRAAAGHDDVRMVRLLLELGADPRETTKIDNYATPEEEARILGRHRSADAIRDWLAEHAR